MSKNSSVFDALNILVPELNNELGFKLDKNNYSSDNLLTILSKLPNNDLYPLKSEMTEEEIEAADFIASLLITRAFAALNTVVVYQKKMGVNQVSEQDLETLTEIIEQIENQKGQHRRS